MSLLPIFLYPLILIRELQWSMLIAIDRVYFVGQNALTLRKRTFGLQEVEISKLFIVEGEYNIN